MRKDAYYFPHDCNAKDDPKCVLLIEQLGLEAYGAYWILIETLRDQPGYRYPLALLPAIARRYNTTVQKIELVIRQYGLFSFDNDDFFFSQSLNRRMSDYDDKRKQRSLAGKASALKRLGSPESATPVQHPFNECSTTVEQREEIREEEIRGDKKREDKKREEDKKTIRFRDVFYHHQTLELQKHRAYTDEMRDAIRRATEILKCDTDHLILLLDRHKKVVAMTAGDEYPVKARGVAEFFGQKAYQAKHLICSEYDEGGAKYEMHLKGGTDGGAAGKHPESSYGFDYGEDN